MNKFLFALLAIVATITTTHARTAFVATPQHGHKFTRTCGGSGNSYLLPSTNRLSINKRTPFNYLISKQNCSTAGTRIGIQGGAHPYTSTV